MRPLHILPDPVARMRVHAAEGYPHEVVGVLAGDAQTRTVRAVAALINERADSPQNRYLVSGLAVMRAEQALEAAGHAILGYYHSHPDHPAIASDFDRDHALPNLSYAILAVAGGTVVDLRSWRLRDDRTAMDEEPVLLEAPLVTILVPTALRAFTGSKASVAVEATTVAEAVDALCRAFPEIAKHLRDDKGNLRSFVNVYLGEDDVRHLQGNATPLAAGAELTIVPSIAGGRS